MPLAADQLVSDYNPFTGLPKDQASIMAHSDTKLPYDMYVLAWCHKVLSDLSKRPE
jgi:hypothetical protein